jgi:hypothetical protein
MTLVYLLEDTKNQIAFLLACLMDLNSLEEEQLVPITPFQIQNSTGLRI